jgi:hypothetical protein
MALINPANGQKLQRTQYSGGWVVKSDGFTDGTSMSVNYLALARWRRPTENSQAR